MTKYHEEYPRGWYHPICIFLRWTPLTAVKIIAFEIVEFKMYLIWLIPIVLGWKYISMIMRLLTNGMAAQISLRTRDQVIQGGPHRKSMSTLFALLCWTPRWQHSSNHHDMINIYRAINYVTFDNRTVYMTIDDGWFNNSGTIP